MQAVALALEHGWSINIGGGMHHACFEARLRSFLTKPMSFRCHPGTCHADFQGADIHTVFCSDTPADLFIEVYLVHSCGPAVFMSTRALGSFPRQDGSGWCAYSDIFLAIRQLRRASGDRVRRFMIIDLDVHQVRLLCSGL